MKFAYTIIYVPDVEHTLTFYEEAFACQKKFLTEEGDYGELLTGETTLAFASLELARTNLPTGYVPNDPGALPAAIEIAFVADDVSAAYARAVSVGCETITGPTTKPWGQDVAYVRDLNGVIVEICSAMG